MKTFWRNNERFADLFNAVAFNGRQVINPDELRPFFSDYKINLVQILDSEHYQFYNEDVKNVFDITQKIYLKNLQGLAEEYTNKSIDSEIINLVTTITGFSKLSDIFNESDNGGGTTMWKCVQEMEDEWVQKGERNSEIKVQKERQTAIITMIELGLTKEQILTKYSEEDYSKAEEALNNKKN